MSHNSTSEDLYDHLRSDFATTSFQKSDDAGAARAQSDRSGNGEKHLKSATDGIVFDGGYTLGGRSTQNNQRSLEKAVSKRSEEHSRPYRKEITGTSINTALHPEITQSTEKLFVGREYEVVGLPNQNIQLSSAQRNSDINDRSEGIEVNNPKEEKARMRVEKFVPCRSLWSAERENAVIGLLVASFIFSLGAAIFAVMAYNRTTPNTSVKECTLGDLVNGSAGENLKLSE